MGDVSVTFFVVFAYSEDVICLIGLDDCVLLTLIICVVG